MDPVTILMVAGAIMSIWSAVLTRANAHTPEEKATADQRVNEAWAAAEALLAPHVSGARSRLEALARGENPYGPGPVPVVPGITGTTLTGVIRASGAIPGVPTVGGPT